jgi:hypothetical protein
MWRLDIGQCPSFTRSQLAASLEMQRLRWVYMGVVVASCLLGMVCVVAGALWHEKDVSLKVAVAMHVER